MHNQNKRGRSLNNSNDSIELDSKKKPKIITLKKLSWTNSLLICKLSVEIGTQKTVKALL